jgi:hypothetical protein
MAGTDHVVRIGWLMLSRHATAPNRGRPMTRTLLLLAMLCLAGTARAETINCTPITSLPATLSSQGVYCLKQDLSTAVTSGNAITVAVNNVTIDCNGYKLGGLAAGTTTRAYGIRADGRLNTVVRNCNVRGFYSGVWMQGGAGHVIEGNRLEGNTYAAIGVFQSDGDLVRDNYVVDTGGNLPLDQFPNGAAFGVGAQATAGTVLAGNTIVNTHATAGSERPAYGIGAFATLGIVENNRITDVMPDGAASGYGIYLSNAGGRVVTRGNSVINPSNTTGAGIIALAGAVAICKDNVSAAFASDIVGCTDAGGNFAD